MRVFTLTAVAAFAATPLPALAQEEAVADELAERLSDPEYQQQIAGTVAVMSEILLDIPVAPLIEAAAEMVGKEAENVDPDATLRQLAGPDADQVSTEIAQNLPRMMETAAGMAEGFATMLPALRQMADRLEENLEELAPPR